MTERRALDHLHRFTYIRSAPVNNSSRHQLPGHSRYTHTQRNWIKCLYRTSEQIIRPPSRCCGIIRHTYYSPYRMRHAMPYIGRHKVVNRSTLKVIMWKPTVPSVKGCRRICKRWQLHGSKFQRLFAFTRKNSTSTGSIETVVEKLIFLR